MLRIVLNEQLKLKKCKIFIYNHILHNFINSHIYIHHLSISVSTMTPSPTKFPNMRTSTPASSPKHPPEDLLECRATHTQHIQIWTLLSQICSFLAPSFSQSVRLETVCCILTGTNHTSNKYTLNQTFLSPFPFSQARPCFQSKLPKTQFLSYSSIYKASEL